MLLLLLLYRPQILATFPHRSFPKPRNDDELYRPLYHYYYYYRTNDVIAYFLVQYIFPLNPTTASSSAVIRRYSFLDENLPAASGSQTPLKFNSIINTIFQNIIVRIVVYTLMCRQYAIVPPHVRLQRCRRPVYSGAKLLDYNINVVRLIAFSHRVCGLDELIFGILCKQVIVQQRMS